jgi:hypothetical protein
MKKTFTFLILLIFNFAFSQNEKEMKISLEKLATEYLTEFYISRNYSESKIWDKGMFIEMQSFYTKNGQGNFSDSELNEKIKFDVEKYFKQLTSFKIEEVLVSEIENWDGKIIGHVFAQYSETLKNKSESVRTMLTFSPTEDGKSWTIQDWKVKDIAKKVTEKLY